MLAVRKASPANTSGADGDYEFLQMSSGRLWVSALLEAGTNTNEVVGDAAHDAAAAGNPVLIGGYASAAAPSNVSADADVVRAWHLRNGAYAVNITAAGALIPGDATNGLDVDVTRMSALVAGEAHVGEVGGKTIVFDLTLSVDTAPYASGDLIADTQQCDAFFRVTNGTGVIQSITVVDEADQKAAIDIYFLNANVSLGTENAAPSISDPNSNNILGWVSVAATDYKDLGGTSIACIRNIGLPVKAVSGTDDLYVAVVSDASAPDYVNADDLILRIGALLD